MRVKGTSAQSTTRCSTIPAQSRAHLGISRVTLSHVLHGHSRISPNLAVRLEEAGVGTARAWLAMQSAHDLAAERAAGLPKVTRFDPVA